MTVSPSTLQDANNRVSVMPSTRFAPHAMNTPNIPL